MQVKKELIEQDIKSMEGSLDNAKAQVNQILGSLATLRGVRDFLDKPEPEVEDKVEEGAKTEISDVNAKVQAEVEAAMSLSELAEAVAGPGAVAEEPVALPAAAEIWEQPKVQPKVDAYGKYDKAVA